MRRLDQGGMSLIELLIAVGILAVMASSVMMARGFIAKQSVLTNDKAFATQKAIQMFEELRALVGGSENGLDVLDSYSNGSLFDNVLTTDTTVDVAAPAVPNPGNPLSGNITTNGHWRYLRQVQVNKIANDPYLRQVIVKVWLYASDQNPGQPGQLLAEVGGQLQTISSVFPPSQVMDVYVLAINNIAGWWVQEPVLYDTFQQIVNSVQQANPGLVLRPHYITRTSYGRDTQYLPYTNNLLSTATATSGGNIPYVYFYPGNTPEDNNAPDTGAAGNFYDPNSSDAGFVGLTGNFNVDGGVQSTSSQFTGCPSWPVADMYNNSERYPDELAQYQAVTNAASNAVLPAQDSVTEMSERMLIENLLSHPTSFTNAMVVNLHGELLPVPPMRNYSDAAKDPGSVDNANDANIRVVTHPEMIYYPGSGANVANVTVRLRVYAYYDGLDNISQLETLYPMASDPKVPVISLFFPDVTEGANTSVAGVSAIIGNSNTCANGVSVAYKYDDFPAIAGTTGTFTGPLADTTNPSGQGPVAINVSYVNPPNNQLLITLYNTRLRAPNGYNSTGTSTNAGLNPADRLYGLEYIPCSPDQTALTAGAGAFAAPFYTFTGQDLTTTGAAGTPKNTARWIIDLTMPVNSTLTGATTYLGNLYLSGFSSTTGTHAIETHIGTYPTAVVGGVTHYLDGYLWGSPPSDASNYSRTYVWTGWGTNGGAFPPWTEQYQYLGDPRHCPYLDVKVGGPNLGQPNRINANGYNWYFKDGAYTGATAGVVTMNKDGYVNFGMAGDTSGTNVNTGAGTTRGGWWGADGNCVDLPRYYQAWRQGLLNSTAIWSTMNGWTYYYYGMGGEFGSDQPPFANGLSINETLYNTTAQAANANVAEIIPYNGTNATYQCVHVPANTNQTWYAKTWMGELYPDSMWGTWNSKGNLPRATGAASNSTFYRENYYTIPTNLGSISTGAGNSLNGMGRDFTNRAGANGCAAFYDGSGAGGQMNHEGNSGTDTLLSLGATCYSIFGYSLAPNIINSNGNFRPWHLSDGQTPPEWSIAPYSSHTSLTIPAVGGLSRYFYESDQGSPDAQGTNWQANGVVQITDGNGKVAYVVESGLAIPANVGTNNLGKTALVTMLRTYMDGGNYTGNSHITQVPLVKLYCDSPTAQYSQPSNVNLVVDGPVTTGTAINVSGTVIASGPTNNIWFRYPGLTSSIANIYTEEYPGYPNLASSTYSETSGGVPLTIDMNFVYSNNAGKNWYYLQDNAAANLGNLDTTPAHLVQSNTFPIPVTWAVPAASFPQGDYDVEVEAFRDAFPLDYSFHELDITINR